MNELNNETAERLMEMLNSSDKDNQVVAVECLNNIDLNVNLGYFLTLYKFSDLGLKEWHQTGLLKKIDPEYLKGFSIGMFKQKFKNYADELHKLVKTTEDLSAIKFYEKHQKIYFDNIAVLLKENRYEE